MRDWRVLAGIAAAVALLGAASYVGYRSARADGPEAPRAPVTVEVTRGDVRQTVIAPGRAVGTHEVLLGMAGGGRLEEIGVRPGSVVERCDVLAQADAKPLERALETARLERDRVAMRQFDAWIDPSLDQAVTDAEEDLAAATLTAPFDGVVLEVSAIEGESVGPSQGFILLADPSAIEVQARVIEEDLPLLSVGQPVELFFDAGPGETTMGRVSRIVPRRIQGENRPLYHVYVSIEGPADGVVSGMTADAAIIVAERTDVLRLPRAVVRSSTNGTARVKVWAAGRVQERTVTTGLRGDVNVEIVDGLREGERVVAE